MDKENKSWLSLISNQCSRQKSLAFNETLRYNGVDFYPINCSYLIEFYLCLNVLMVHQEWIREKKLAKLPYLWFITYACEHSDEYPNNPEYKMFLPMLYSLLEMSTRSTDYDIMVEKKPNGDYQKCNLIIQGNSFSYKNFEELKRILLEQAGVEEEFKEFIHEDAWKAINADREFENKQNKHVPPTIEDLVDIVALYYHMSNAEVKESFTIRKFNNAIKRMSMFEDWRVMKAGECSGMVKYKNPITHWISGFPKHNPFEGLNINYMDKLKKSF